MKMESNPEVSADQGEEKAAWMPPKANEGGLEA